MQAVAGRSVLRRIAIGPLRVITRTNDDLNTTRATDIAYELQRFEAAHASALEREKEYYQKALAETGPELAEVFHIHAAMLEDRAFVRGIRDRITMEHDRAGAAVRITGGAFAAQLRAINDPYLSARSADVEDVTRTLLEFLSDTDSDAMQDDSPAILAARSLSPSEFVRLNKENLLGIVTVEGSDISHTAIMARCMGIPSLVKCGAKLDASCDGHMAILDGLSGMLYIDPTPEMLEQYRERHLRGKQHLADLAKLKGLPNQTLDGTTIRLEANLTTLDELPLVEQNDAQGVGLFRSEFLYLGNNTIPTETQQFTVYRSLLEKMGGRRVVVRTCDLGADKMPDYLPLPKEENPALGHRAIRMCLTYPELFRPQLRALLRAACFGPLDIMFPMISSVEELEAAQKVLENCRRELELENIPYGRLRVGTMIETPAAALCADELAARCDFFSIGTNDLTQYTCALDRQSREMQLYFDPHHPAVLKLIELTVQAAHRHGISVGVCGEMGSDPSLTEWFLRLGVDSLSITPIQVLPLRESIRKMDLRQPPTPLEDKPY